MTSQKVTKANWTKVDLRSKERKTARENWNKVDLREAGTGRREKE